MNMGSTTVIRVLRRDISMDRDSLIRFSHTMLLMAVE